MAPLETIKLINIVHTHTHPCLHRTKHKESYRRTNQNIVVRNEISEKYRKDQQWWFVQPQAFQDENDLYSFMGDKYSIQSHCEKWIFPGSTPSPLHNQQIHSGAVHDINKVISTVTSAASPARGRQCQVCGNKGFCVALHQLELVQCSWGSRDVSECSSVGG